MTSDQTGSGVRQHEADDETDVAPIRVTTLQKQVADAVRDMILRGDLAGGTRINEVHLSSSLGVSRTPLREGLRLLASEGLVDLAPHRGASVSVIGPAETLDHLELLGVLDGLCARRAARYRTSTDLRALRNLLARLERGAREGDLEMYDSIDDRFHDLVRTISGNAAAAEAARRAVMQLGRSGLALSAPPQRLADSLAEHARILATIEDRDPEGAEAAARGHVTEWLRTLRAEAARHEHTPNERILTS